MPKYMVKFGPRLGRGPGPEPFTAVVDSGDPDELAAVIYNRVRGRFISRGVEVTVELDEDGNGDGWVATGFHAAGTFTVTLVAGTGGPE